MLIQLIAQHPEALPSVVHGTPGWVWGVATGLAVLGASQLKDRQASLTRISLTPLAMTAFSIWGTVSAFRASSLLAQALAIWIVAALAVFAWVARLPVRARYDASARSYAIPGSVVPLLLMLGIFLVKYVVGVDLHMAPQLMHESSYALTVAGLYGAFTGVFVGRAARLWKLALPNRRSLVV
jgi:predicted neutral ceramidase superfamily lipid hydrolase